MPKHILQRWGMGLSRGHYEIGTNTEQLREGLTRTKPRQLYSLEGHAKIVLCNRQACNGDATQKVLLQI